MRAHRTPIYSNFIKQKRSTGNSATKYSIKSERKNAFIVHWAYTLCRDVFVFADKLVSFYLLWSVKCTQRVNCYNFFVLKEVRCCCSDVEQRCQCRNNVKSSRPCLRFDLNSDRVLIRLLEEHIFLMIADKIVAAITETTVKTNDWFLRKSAQLIWIPFACCYCERCVLGQSYSSLNWID